MDRTFRARPADIGRSRARYLRQRLADELKIARAAAGMTQAQLAAAAGVTQAFVSAVEGGTRRCSIDVAARLGAAVGHELTLRLFPADGVSLRDSGQLAVGTELVASAHSAWHPHLEMPVAANDRRAADVVLVGPEEVLHLEIETRLVDFQAQLRAAQLKRAKLADHFTQPVRLVLVIADRKSTRMIIRRLAPMIDRAMPVPSRVIRRAIQTGHPVGADGILFWPMPPPHAPRRTGGR